MTAKIETQKILGATYELDLSNRAHVALVELVWDIERAERDLVSKGAELTRTIERVTANIEAGNHINGLGELQSSATTYDALCATRQSLINQIKKAIWVSELVAIVEA